MTQLSPALVSPPSLPRVQRMASGIYRVTQSQVATSFATKRVLGMWVPADAFRKGTIITVAGASSTASPLIRLSIGGPGNTLNGGVSLSWTTGPAAACAFRLTATQRADGILPTFDTSGFFSGATSSVVTTGTFVPFIQPLNFVEMNCSGTFTLFGCVLEVIPPQWNTRPNGEMLDV